MKTLKLVMFFISALGLTACGYGEFKSSPVDANRPGPTKANDEQALQDEMEKSADQNPIVTTEPGELPKLVVGQTYLVRSELQTFALQSLSHLIFSGFHCDLDMIIYNRITEASLKIYFYPEMRIFLNGHDFATTKSVCGENVEEKGLLSKGRGGLYKNRELNTYHLTYTMDSADPVHLQMQWDAARQNKGQLNCKRASGSYLKHAVIRSCTLVTNPNLKN